MKKRNKPDEFCICVRCDVRVPHKLGIPCRETVCPDCGKTMMKEGSYHHRLYLEKKDKSDNSI